MKICGIAGQWDAGLLQRNGAPDSLTQLTQVKATLESLIKEGVEEFVIAMDEGSGLLSAIALRILRSEGKQARMTCLLLWEEQAARWPESIRSLWFSTIAECDRELLLESCRSDQNTGKRDAFLLEHCDGLLLLWDGGPGAVWSLAAQAREAGMPIRELAQPAPLPPMEDVEATPICQAEE